MGNLNATMLQKQLPRRKLKTKGTGTENGGWLSLGDCPHFPSVFQRPMPTPLVSLNDVTVRLGGVEILSHITATIEAGKLTALIGPNGSGKTTLLKAILGLVPYSGAVTLNGERQSVGYVPQRLELDRTLPVTVGSFVAALLGGQPLVFGAGTAGKRRVAQVLTRCNAAELATKPLGALSGGEMQRVLLAVALEPAPKLLLLDEPASGMDITAESLLYETVRKLVRESGVGVVMVSHDLSVVSDITDHVLCINRALVCEGGPHDIMTDATIARVFGHGHGVYHHHHDGEPHGHDHGAHSHEGGGHG